MAQRGTTAAIDLEELEKLSALQCTDEELAAWFKVSTRTIERRRKEPEFAEAMERGKARGRMSIRRAQMRMLEQGNATMGVWLGKQYLGQTDHFYPESAGQQIYIVAPAVSIQRQPTLEAPEDDDTITIDIVPGR
jgi:hypothetical protein